MSLRRLRVLLEHLPPESATKTALRAAAPAEARQAPRNPRPDLAPWSNGEMLLASIVDAVNVNTATVIASVGGKPAAVEPIPRPGIPPKQKARTGLTPEQRRALDPRLRNQPDTEASDARA